MLTLLTLSIDPNGIGCHANLGLFPTHRIVRIGDRPIKQWEEVLLEWTANPGKTLAVQVERGADTRELTVTPQETDGLTLYGEQKKVGDVDGLIAIARNTGVGVSDPASQAFSRICNHVRRKLPGLSGLLKTTRT